MAVKATALVEAAERGDIQLVKQYIDNGAHPDSGKNMFGNTATLEAAANNHVAILGVLLQNKANPDFRNLFGKTALDLAVKKKSHACAFVLKQEQAKRTQVLGPIAESPDSDSVYSSCSVSPPATVSSTGYLSPPRTCSPTNWNAMMSPTATRAKRQRQTGRPSPVSAMSLGDHSVDAFCVLAKHLGIGYCSEIFKAKGIDAEEFMLTSESEFFSMLKNAGKIITVIASIVDPLS